MEYISIKNDTNGNPRYVFHFWNFLSQDEQDAAPQGMNRISYCYNLAIQKAKSIGGKKYTGKDFGGGIVIQSYNITNTIKQIENLAK